jgi:hypothetical protein
MHRVLTVMVILSLAFFAGNPVYADMIFAGADQPEAVQDASAKGAEILDQVADAPAQADAETLAHFNAHPDQVDQVGSIEMVGVIALAILLGSIYFFGATDTEHPGW